MTSINSDFDDVINALCMPCLECGLKPSEFWDLTPVEAFAYIKAQRRMYARRDYDVSKISAIFQAVNLSNAFGKSKRHYPEITDFFDRELFDDNSQAQQELTEEQQMNMRIMQIKAQRVQMLAFRQQNQIK